MIEHASTASTSIVGALNGALPNYMLELDSYSSERTMAFAAGKLDNNTTPITVETARDSLVRKECAVSGIDYESA